MITQSILDEMKARSMSGELSFSDKEFIKQNYERITFKEFKGTSCKRCYADAFIEMYVTFKKYGLRDMANFKLRRGAILRSAKFSDIVTNANITDEIAIEWLKDNPSRIDYFEAFPKDWESLIGNTRPKEKVKKAPKEKPKNKVKEVQNIEKDPEIIIEPTEPTE